MVFMIKLVEKVDFEKKFIRVQKCMQNGVNVNTSLNSQRGTTCYVSGVSRQTCIDFRVLFRGSYMGAHV